jgi:hypothetical protein
LGSKANCPGGVGVGFEVALVLGQQRGVAREGFAQVGIVRLKQWQYFVTDAVARVTQVAVGGVLARLPATLGAIGERLGVGEVQQWAREVAL